MERSEQQRRRTITGKLKCPNCGASVVQLPSSAHSRWWCSACWKGSDLGPLITQEPPPLVDDTRLLEGAAYLKTQNLAHGLDANERDGLVHQFEAIERAFRMNFASAWKSCDAELQAIRKAHDGEKLRAFHHWLNRWLRELIKLQRQIINVVKRLPDQYRVSQSKREEWIDEAFEVFWIRLGRQYSAWIVAAAFEPGSETAPAWLCRDTVGTLFGYRMERLSATTQTLITEQIVDRLEGDIDRKLRRARHATDRSVIAMDIAATALEASNLVSLSRARLAEQPPVETRRMRLSPIRRNSAP